MYYLQGLGQSKLGGSGRCHLHTHCVVRSQFQAQEQKIQHLPFQELIQPVRLSLGRKNNFVQTFFLDSKDQRHPKFRYRYQFQAMVQNNFCR